MRCVPDINHGNVQFLDTQQPDLMGTFSKVPLQSCNACIHRRKCGVEKLVVEDNYKFVVY